MPVNIQPATLKYKNSNGVYQSADCLKGEKGNPGAAGNAGLIAPDYDDLTFPVTKGQHCTYDSKYYYANQDIQTSETFTDSHWTNIGNIGNENAMIKSLIDSTLSDTAGCVPIHFIPNYKIPISTTVDLTSLTYDVRFEYAIVSASTGDVFTINANGFIPGAGQVTWAFVDSSWNVLVKEANGETKPIIVTAPTDTAYLVMNNKIANEKLTYKGKLLVKTVDKLLTETKYILKKEIPLDYGFYYKSNVSQIDLNVRNYGSYDSAIVLCNPGDIFIIYGTGGDADRLWTFTDGNLNVITQANAYATMTGGTIKAPENAKYLFIARNHDSTICMLDNTNNLQKIKQSEDDSEVFNGEINNNTEVTGLNQRSVNRIPFCAYTKAGTLIVGADARNSPDDKSVTDIYIVRSADNGETFGEPIKVLEAPTSATYSRVNDGQIVVSSTGRIFIFGHWQDTDEQWEYVTDPTSQYRPLFDIVYKYSDDDGVTWSNQFSLQDLYIDNSAIITLLASPGAGITMENGIIVVPCYCKMASGQTYGQQSCFIWTSDDGETWNISDLVPESTGESTIVEYEKNKLMINCRSISSKRWVYVCEYAESEFGSWSTHQTNRTFIEPTGCQASLLKYQFGYRSIGLFTNPMSTTTRAALVLQASKTYNEWFPIIKLCGPSVTGAGYTCMAYKDNHLVCACEAYQKIYLVDLSECLPIIFGI